MVGTDEMIDLDTLPESQATSIAAFGGPVSQQLLDATAPIEDGEEYIQWLKKLSQCLINFNCMLDIIMDKLYNILKIFPH